MTRVLVLLAGLALAVALRFVIAGAAGPRSVQGAAVFAVALAVLAAAAVGPAGWRGRPTVRRVLEVVGIGLAGAAVICLPVALRLGFAETRVDLGRPDALWLGSTIVVAFAEEALLRGALHTAVLDRCGAVAAVMVGAVAFGLMHVPLYGWGVLAVDTAVGVWLGALRVTSRTWLAPGMSHAVADLVGWWIR